MYINFDVHGFSDTDTYTVSAREHRSTNVSEPRVLLEIYKDLLDRFALLIRHILVWI